MLRMLPDRSEVYSVSALTAELKTLLETGYPSVWVEGEISSFTAAPSGHWYFTLKDGGAQIQAVMFRSQTPAARLPMRNGLGVWARGRLSLYPARGTTQLIVERLVDRGAGRLYELIEERRAKLAAEGLFDAARKRPLPFLPHRIALVTSPTGAVVHDLLRVIHRRAPGQELVLVPTLVQGAEAPEAIVTALVTAVSLADVELVIVARGGGSVEDLMAFNDESVVRAVAACPVPVISAVGHETDVTLCDFAADVRAATPSVAGELAVPETVVLALALRGHERHLRRAMSRRLHDARAALREIRARLVSPCDALSARQAHLRTLEARLRQAMRQRLALCLSRQERLRLRLHTHSPEVALTRARHRELLLRTALQAALERRLDAARTRFAHLALRLDALSPLAVLARGYALVEDERGRLLFDADAVPPRARLTIYLARGRLVVERLPDT